MWRFSAQVLHQSHPCSWLILEGTEPYARLHGITVLQMSLVYDLAEDHRRPRSPECLPCVARSTGSHGRMGLRGLRARSMVAVSVLLGPYRPRWPVDNCGTGALDQGRCTPSPPLPLLVLISVPYRSVVGTDEGPLLRETYAPSALVSRGPGGNSVAG